MLFQYGALTRGSGVDPRGLTFAVIDLETTGLDPARGSRVCEVGVVRMRGDGYVLDEFATLVNPQLSRISNSDVHGITTAMVKDAPTFGEIAGDLLAVLSDAIIVGHNLEFEEKFLAAEFTRLGLRPTGVPGLCTLVTARSQLDLWGYRLPDLTLRLTGEWPSAQHSALGDARACALVLAELISNAPHPLRYAGPAPRPLPPAPRSGRVAARVVGLRRGNQGWLSSLVAQLPLMSQPPAPRPAEVAKYKALLGHVLADGKVTGEEAQQLAVLAARAGLTQTTAQQVHQEFLLEVRAKAEADGVVTAAELRELQRAAKNLAAGHLIRDLEEAAAADRARKNGPLKGWRILPVGDDPSVIQLMDWAVGLGATAAVNVTKTVRMAVRANGVEDPRLAKAAVAGIPVLDPETARARLEQVVAEASSTRSLLDSEEGERIATELERIQQPSRPEWHEHWRRRELDPRHCRGNFKPTGTRSGYTTTIEIPKARIPATKDGGCALVFLALTASALGLTWSVAQLVSRIVA
ncbi:Exonuclease [Carbonactinospora thermoautotrophica]|uniref:Exonuclease n=1 Tax=Carbonactinospora thermoautotrophica TaxID=1469144 RepID=A0A132MVG7_9ACTN|nr:3'-5' exonuclease [Carbonactinospora thermoautotrophica]KWX01833.1 Exonuclease [Carbonactinospora thermoautotrophica]